MRPRGGPIGLNTSRATTSGTLPGLTAVQRCPRWRAGVACANARPTRWASRVTAHADGDALALEPLGEHHAGELRTLVGIEDLRLDVTRDRMVEHAHAEVRFHRHRHVPGRDLAAMSVNDRGQVHEAACHRDAGQVHRPDLVRTLDRQAAQQVPKF